MDVHVLSKLKIALQMCFDLEVRCCKEWEFTHGVSMQFLKFWFGFAGCIFIVLGSGATPQTVFGESPLPSRGEDAHAFYVQPAGLSDDYPFGSSIEKVKRDFAAAKAVGAKHFRFGLSWAQTEAERGDYDWEVWDALFDLAPQYGLTLLPYFCYTPEWASSSNASDFWRAPPRDLKDFSDFVATAVERYKGKAHSWEIWNEPDNKAFWTGSSKQFIELAKAGAQSVRRVDSSAKIVLGGLSRGPYSSFLKKLLNAKPMIGLYDVINIHGYHETWEPELTEDYIAKFAEVSELATAANVKADIWLAEFGYSNTRFKQDTVSEWGVDVHYAYEHTAEYQAKMLWKHHVMALASGRVSLSTWYRVNDLPEGTDVIGDKNNLYLGILDINHKPKPSYYALKLFNRIFSKPVRRITQGIKIKKAKDSQAVVEAFETKQGEVIVTAWLRSSKRSELKDKSGMAQDNRRERVELTAAGFGAELVVKSCDVGKAFVTRLPCQKRKLSQEILPISLAGGDEIFIGEIKNLRVGVGK